MDKSDNSARNLAIINLARAYENEGDLELDDDELVVISEGDDNGAYVKMWKWVDFAGTELCKGDDGDHGNCGDGCPHGTKLSESKENS